MLSYASSARLQPSHRTGKRRLRSVKQKGCSTSELKERFRLLGCGLSNLATRSPRLTAQSWSYTSFGTKATSSPPAPISLLTCWHRNEFKRVKESRPKREASNRREK